MLSFFRFPEVSTRVKTAALMVAFFLGHQRRFKAALLGFRTRYSRRNQGNTTFLPRKCNRHCFQYNQRKFEQCLIHSETQKLYLFTLNPKPS